MHAARLHVEALLRAKRLDRTVTDARAPVDPARAAPSGLAWLDARLGGGWPCGETSEVVGAASSGRTSVLTAALAAATGRGELAALVDASDRFDAVTAQAAGVGLDHLLWVRGESRPQDAIERGAGERGRGARHRGERALVGRAIKAFGLVLEAGGFGLVVLDVADVAPADLARLPFTTWRRLQRLIDGRDTVALVVAPVALARSARGVTIALSTSPATPVWVGQGHRARRLAGLTLAADVRAARRL